MNGKIYHLYNRGADKRPIVQDNNDRFRFIHSLFEFNDIDNVLNVYRRSNQLIEVRPQSIGGCWG